MRIAIDGRELHGKATGVGRYLSELLNAWKAMPVAAVHEFVLLAPSGGASGTAWEQLVLPRLIRRSGAQVFFAPAYTGPMLSPLPMVVTIHDMSFAAHPRWFSWREGVRRRTLTRLSARRAARVVTVSEFSKREIIKHTGVPADHVEVIYSGITSMAEAARAGTRRPGTVLFVGSVFNRRNVPQLIEGFARLARRHPGVRLELVGDNRTSPPVDLQAVIRASGAADRVRVRAYLSDTELRLLYGEACAFAFLSDYEGFGLPPIEALSAGIPLVVLDTPVAREIYGPAAIYVARPDPALIEPALERALFDQTDRARVLDAAPGVLARYSWEESARRTLQILLACAR
jgi:glycosyltransferase involved in cell wall biosynthesis